MRKYIKKMKIRTQLMVAFLLVITISLTVLIISLVNINGLSVAINGLYSRALLPLDYVSQSTRLMETVKIEGRTSLLNKSPQTRDDTAREIIKAIEQTKVNMTAFGETIVRQEAHAPYNRLMEALDEYLSLMDPFRLLLSENLTDQDNQDRALAYLEERLSPISDICLESLASLNTIRLGLAEELMESAMDSSALAFYTMIAFSVAGFLLAVLLGVYFSVYLSKPILKGVEVVAKAAEGDFSVSLPQDYGAEIGQLYRAFNLLLEYNRQNIATMLENCTTMRDSAQNMLAISSQMEANSKGLNEQTSFVSTAAEEFSAGMLQSSESLSTASTHIRAVASSIEEINSTIGVVAEAAEQTSTRVGESNALVDSIKTSISMASGSVSLVSGAFNSVAVSVKEINRSIEVINEHCAAAMRKVSDADSKAGGTALIIRQLEASSKQIGKIVSIISDIADQTNMLALNAAIEAAGAGEAGKGFMVVAGEVKELARQTADATDDIAEQIETMQKNMPEAVVAVSEIAGIINSLAEFMQSLTQEVTQQNMRSDQIAEESASAARRMSEITREIGRISENALSVTTTVVESSKGVDEIAKSTAELVIGTQEIAMNSERASNNISEIDRATKEMSAGLVEITKNVQMIHAEAGSVQESASLTNRASEALLSAANEMENFVSIFKLK